METIVNTQKKLEHIHFETLDWKSALQFIDDEVHFIHQLVGSYSFEPNTPNLFESLQKFKWQISEIKKKLKIYKIQSVNTKEIWEEY